MSDNYMVTISDIEQRINRLRDLPTGDIDYIVERWSQGRAVKLPLTAVEPLLVSPEKVKAIVEEAVRRLLKLLGSHYRGVEIFSIESPMRVYGTGKTQVMYFVGEELEKRGVPVEYLSVGPTSVERGKFRETLWEAGARESKAVVFIDEVDTLFSPEFDEDRQRSIVEAFANAVIEYSEGLSHRGYSQALVLVLSHEARDYIEGETTISSRFGRRIMNTLVQVDISLTRDAVSKIFASVSALAAVHMDLEKEKILLLADFADDYSRWLWDDRKLASISVGQAVTTALNFTRMFVRGLRHSNYKEVQRVLNSKTELGGKVEDVVRSALAMLLPKVSEEVKDLQLVVECEIDPAHRQAGSHRSDVQYVISIGGLEVGRCMVEVTTESKLSPRKEEQLRAFASKYPTVLVYAYEDLSQVKKVEEFLRKVNEFLGTLPSYEVLLREIPLPLFKYPAALGAHGVELSSKLAKELKLHEYVEAVLRKSARVTAYKWFAHKKAEEARREPAETAEKLQVEALRSILKAALTEAFFDKRKGREKKAAERDTIIQAFEKNLKESYPELRSDFITAYTKDVIKKWRDAKLGSFGNKRFTKGEGWDEEKAVEIAVDVFAKHVKEIKPTSGLVNRLDRFLEKTS